MVDITTPMAAAEVEVPDHEEEDVAEEQPGYNLRRGPRREEPVHLEVGEAYQEEGRDVDNEEDDYRELDQRVTRGIGRSLWLEPHGRSSSCLEYLVYFELMAEFQQWIPREAAMVLVLSLKGVAKTKFNGTAVNPSSSGASPSSSSSSPSSRG